MAHLTAFELAPRGMAPGSSRFAAHVATYPGGSYGLRAEAGVYTGAPILMLLGEKDDNLPVAKVEGYLAYANGAGHPAPITTVIYPGAFHAWTVPTLGAPHFYAQYLSTRKCPVFLFARGAPTVLLDGARSRSTRTRSPRASPRGPATPWRSTGAPGPDPPRTPWRFSSVT